jgi:L-lactate dehydrogenase complex protein LldE
VTRVGDAPLRLLRNVRGLELVDLPRADECCGFGGTFAIKNAETSSAMLTDKCEAIESTGAALCTAVDSSCLLQIGGALSRRASAVRPVHIAEILAST